VVSPLPRKGEGERRGSGDEDGGELEELEKGRMEESVMTTKEGGGDMGFLGLLHILLGVSTVRVKLKYPTETR